MKINDFITAKISTGTYDTKGYWFKTYKTKKGLERYLKSIGCILSEIGNYENFNSRGVNYTVRLLDY